MKQEILLRHMGIINIGVHGYCHARVHAGVTPTVPPSSLRSCFITLFLLTENDAHLTFKAPCSVAIECGLAMDLLL